MALSQTAFVNKALTMCGAAPITNIDDDTNNARVANRVYEISRQSTLSDVMPNCATTRGTLSLSAVTMPWTHDGEAYVYVRPANALRIIEMSDPKAKWREEGDYIIADTASLGIKYIFDLDVPEKYPPSLVDALIDNLCANICYMIVNSAKKAEGFMAKYEKVSLIKAQSINAQTGTHLQPNDDAWELAKYANGSSEA